MFSENPKEPAVIISSFRKENNNDKPLLKAAFINGDVFVGNDQLKALTQIKTKNEMIGEIIGLLQSPIQRVLGALQNKEAAKTATVSVVDSKPVVSETLAIMSEAESASPTETVPVVNEVPAAENTATADITPAAIDNASPTES